MATINIRIDEKEKQQAQEVLDQMGLDMSTAVKMYLRQIVNIQGLPFTATTANGLTLKKELEVLEIEQEILTGKGEAATIEDLIEDLKKRV